MIVALLDVQTRKDAINKTMAGGFGSSSSYSKTDDNILINILKLVKRKSVKIPTIELAYLAAIFRLKGHEIKIMYGNKLPEADLYIIYGSSVEFDAETQMAARIKKVKPEAKVGFIGVFPTVRPEIFKNYSDFVIAGEPESFFLNFNGDLKSLDGILSTNHLDNLDLLPYPNWSNFPMNEFIHYHFFGKKPLYPVLTSRGCSFSCKYYCNYPLLAGSKVRFRSVENVIDELKYLTIEYNAEAVLFRDANFGINKDYTIKLCEDILRNNLKFRWACETHPSCLDRGLIDLMYKSGNRAITIGVETRNPEVIKQSRRKDTKEDHLQDIVRYCENKHIKIMAQYIIGSIADNKQTVLDAIKYATRLNTSFAQFNISTPYPGTEYYESLKDKLTTGDWTKYDACTLVFNHPNFSFKDLENLKKQGYVRYYYRPRWVASRLVRNKIYDFFNRR